MKHEDLRVKTDPSKSFFIDMLTRDIGTKDCILDLIDNSIDSIIKHEKKDIIKLVSSGIIKDEVFKNHNISLTLKKDQFEISDNCFGITIDEARNYAFRFGTVKEKIEEKKGLSVYGIGMKRAFFKLGKKIHIESTTENSYFDMDIDVAKWESEEVDWDFSFGKIERKMYKSTGTKLIITEISSDLSERALNTIFIEELGRVIEKAFSLYIDAGLVIKINGTKLVNTFPEFISSENIGLTRKSYSLKHKNESDVNILIIAGLTSKEENNYRGWYVFCNGRLILSNNTDFKTGWGNGLPSFHYKYNHFVGFLHIFSNDGHALPWTTTKEDIEYESLIYQTAIEKAKLIAKPFLDYLSREYQKKSGSEDVTPDIFRNTKLVQYKDIPEDQMIVTKISKDKREKKTAIISYSKSLEDIQLVKKLLGDEDLSNSKIGEMTFEYFLSMEGK